jgi:hypothetical protein
MEAPPQGPVTLILHGRPVVISVEEIDNELNADGRFRSLMHLEAVVRANDRARAIGRLQRAIAGAGPGAQTTQAVLGLVRLDAAPAADELRALADRLGGSPGAIARAAAFLVEDRLVELAEALRGDAALARHSPQAYLWLNRVPPGAPHLFSAWLDILEDAAHGSGVTAYRAFLGDVAEAAFRALQHGHDETALLGPSGPGFLVDTLCAELPGTTDFIAARGMVWLLGTLAPEDDTARSAIERARARFRDPAFQADCEAILARRAWPPPPRLR